MIFFKVTVTYYIIQGVVLLVLAFRGKRIKNIDPLPTVAVLMAFRNEQESLPASLKGLQKLHYPKDKLQVLLGDDESSDESLDIAQRYVSNNENWEIVGCKGYESKNKAKARVLELLFRKAEADFYLVLDADVMPSETIIEALLSEMNNKVGLVSGNTLPAGTGFWKNYDRYDWFWNLVQLKSLNQFGDSATALGNTMLVSKEAYHTIGGFENISFSVTEDAALNTAMKQHGYKPKFSWCSEAYSETRASAGLLDLLKQRKRWMTGVSQTSWFVKLLLFIQILEVPILITSVLIIPEMLPFMFLWMVIKFKVALIRALKLGKVKLVSGLVPYIICSPVINLAILLYGLLTKKVEWKERTYS